MFRHPRTAAVLALAGLFAFRLFYGLSMPFWVEDERQVYLIGLRSLARGDWPYFGADVVWTGGQVPGALLGWLIRLPLAIWPAPESPVLLLNIVSFAALSLLAWYVSRRLSIVPRWLIWGSLLTLPWTLNYSTHVVNPSYVLAGAIVFFVGFFEATPQFMRRILPFGLAWSMMGAGLLWVMQIHMSWVLLVPYVIAAIAAVAISKSDVLGMSRLAAMTGAVLAFALGAVIPGCLLIPTIAMYGWGASQVQGAIELHRQSPLEIVATAARVLSFASFEVNRFIGLSTAERWLALSRQPLIAVTAVPVVLAGIIHPLWMAVSAFRKPVARQADRLGATDWTRVRLLLLATIVLITGSYYFSIRGPQAHSFYLVFPVAVLFAFTCWSQRAQAHGGRMRGLERLAMVVIGANVLMHAGLAADRLPRQSLYVDRGLVAAAILERNDRYLGNRRNTANAAEDRDPRPSDPVLDVDAYRAAVAVSDLQLTSFQWTPVADRISSFTVTLANRSRAAAWLDFRFATTYIDAAGVRLDSRGVVVKQILQPGESRTWTDVADGWIPEGTKDATVAVVGAEKAIPRRAVR